MALRLEHVNGGNHGAEQSSEGEEVVCAEGRCRDEYWCRERHKEICNLRTS